MALQSKMIFASGFVLGLLFGGPAGAQTWIDDSFEDFAAGTLDGSGQNLYVSRDGKIRTIHRFDLNDDGYIDLIFNNTHDRRSFIPATLAVAGADGGVEHSPLAVEGSIQAVFSDLNRDGFLDVVFCPNASGVQTKRRFLTIIYGGEDGWPAHRATGLLPVHGARAVAVADLDADQWPDIVTLNDEAWLPGQPGPGKILRIFWGSATGFMMTRHADLALEGAAGLAAADLDEDGALDLAVLAGKKLIIYQSDSTAWDRGDEEKTEIALPGAGVALAAGDATGDGHADVVIAGSEPVVYLLAGSGSWDLPEPRPVPAFKATHVAIGDLDNDQRPELLLTHFAQNRAGGGEPSGAARSTASGVRVLWGADSWDVSSATTMEAPNAVAAAAGDLDGDGRADLAVAIHQGQKTYLTGSAIFFGKGDRRFARAAQDPPTQGAMHAAIAAATKHHPARAVFSNSLGGTVGELILSQVFWGGPEGFDASRQWEFEMRSGYESSAADLNADGFADLIVVNSGHAGAAARSDPTLGANIFWGATGGFDPGRRRTVLREPDLGSTNIADLDRDGYLDLVLGSFSVTAPLVIYYGGPDGYPASRRAAIASEGRSTEPVIADFNRDGWLDIAVSSFAKHRVRIFWGGPRGFDPSRQAGLDVPAPIGMEAADLNADGQLDLIVASYQDPVEGRHDAGLTIFWGGAGGFTSANSQWLPGMSPISPVVADFDADGYLDIFVPNYQSDLTREFLPNYLYWGSEHGFAPRRRKVLICNSAHDGLAADFDRDGRLDLAIVCHTTDGDHRTSSKVFYNDGSRFENPRVQRLPARGPHWMWSQDMGHIEHRRWEQSYTSAVFEWKSGRTRGRVTYRGEVPAGAALSFQIRSAEKAGELPSQPWKDTSSGAFSLRASDRSLQYRAILKSGNGDRYPVIDRVMVTLQD